MCILPSPESLPLSLDASGVAPLPLPLRQAKSDIPSNAPTTNDFVIFMTLQETRKTRV
jgi:hypothetical protein